MKRTLVILMTLACLSCGGDDPGTEETSAQETAGDTAASSTSTAGGYVENVTRAQKKAREMSEEEGERVKEVDEAMKEP